MGEHDLLLARFRERLPEGLRPFWTYGVTVMLPVLAAALWLIEPSRLVDYPRIAIAVLVVYVVAMLARVITLRIQTKLVAHRNKVPPNMATELLDAISWAFLGYAIILVAIAVAQLQRFGEPSVVGWVPWVYLVGIVIQVLAINIIWRVTLLREAEVLSWRP